MNNEDKTPLDLAYEVVDRLMLAGPGSWSTLTLSFTPVGDTFAVLRQEADLSGDWPVVSFPSDTFQQTAFLNGAFDALHKALARDGVSWRWGGARITRAPSPAQSEQIELVLLDDDAPTARFELAAADLLFGHELSLEYEAHEAAFAEHQARLAREASGWPHWMLNAEAGTLDFLERDADAEVLVARCPALVVGSYARLEQTWCWAWANRQWTDHDALIAPVRQLALDAAEWPGVGVFRMPAFHADPIFSDALAQLAAHRIGGYPVYFGRLEALTLYVAVTGPVQALA